MKRLVLFFCFLIVPGVVAGAVYWKRASASRRQQVEQARALLGTRQGRAALDELAGRYPDDAEVVFLRAQQLRLDGQPRAAELSLNQAAALGWPRAEVERQRWLCRANADFREAEAQLQGLLDLDPNDQDVLLSLAYGYSLQERPEVAWMLVNRLLKNDPHNGAALCLSGRIALQIHQADRAVRDLGRAMEVGKDQYYYATARLLLADALRGMQKVEEAYRLYQECRAEDPDSFRVLYSLGQSAHYLNRVDEAVEAFQAALGVRPRDPETLLQLALIFDERKDLPRAIEMLKQVEQDYPNDPQMLFQMAKLLKAQGHTAEAALYRKRYETVKEEWDRRDDEEAARARSH